MDLLDIEREYLTRGFRAVAGVDEVGRGPLAGPVVCAAVILPTGEEERIFGIDDSKKLSAKKREALSEQIMARSRAYAIAKRAVEKLRVAVDMVLTDGNMTLDIGIPQKSIVKGDALVASIGAASILAKVYRDALMKRFADEYPMYGFERNAGYGTAEHIRAIREVGICKIHRKTFVKKFWDGRENR